MRPRTPSPTRFIRPAPGASDLLSISSPSTTDTAGKAQSFTVTVLGPSGGTDTHYTGTIHFTSSDPQAMLPANYTFTTADAGVHTFTGTLKTAGVQSVSATDTINQSIIGADENIWVQPALAQSLVVTGFPTTDMTGAANHLTVTAYDQYGNVATGYTDTVQFTSSDSKAVLPASYHFTPEDEGTHTFTAMLQTVGLQSITATDTVTPSITGTESNITVKSGPAYSLKVSGFPNPEIAGTVGNFTVTVYDQYGDVDTGYTGTVKFTSSDPKAALPAQLHFHFD